MKTESLGLFFIILGISLYFIHANSKCPKHKIEYRNTFRDLDDDLNQFKL